MYKTTKPYTKTILKLIKSTWTSPHLSVKEGLYPIFKKKFNYQEVDHTDGVGTKGIFHWQKRALKNAVIDALAMNLNDLAMIRAIPYKLQNQIIIPEDDHGAILKIVKALSQECRKRRIVITGGETSIHNNSRGLDISMTVSGFIPKLKPNQFHVDDILIGIKSSGLHSNGFTRVREVFGSRLRPEFVAPTRIYIDQIIKLEKKIKINGLMHITGGAFTKLKQILPKNCNAMINRSHKLRPQKIFYELYKRGVGDNEMYKTFNCGIGFIFSTPPQGLKKIKLPDNMAIIGKIITGSGKIKIESMFDKRIIEY